MRSKTTEADYESGDEKRTIQLWNETSVGAQTVAQSSFWKVSLSAVFIGFCAGWSAFIV